MAHGGWWLAGVLAVVFACNSDKPSPFATKPSSPSSGSAASAGSATGSAPTGSAAGSSAVTTASADVFAVDDVIWSLWANGFAYRGKILAINKDGSYQVQWDGLGRNDHWDASRAKRDKPTEDPVKVGERVWSLPDMWEDNRPRQGKILRINADGTYRMSWDDTDDTNTAKEWLSRNKPPPPSVTGLKVGERVDGLWSDNRWYPGKAGSVNADGTYFINFDDGDKAALDGQHVRRRKAATGGGSSKAAGGKPCNEGNYYTRCDEYHCFNLSQDDHNCGACGNQCPKNARTCVNSECKCLSGTYDSDGDCN